MSQHAISVRQARTALNSIDEYARSTHIDLASHSSVLSQFIEQVERAEASDMRTPLYAPSSGEYGNFPGYTRAH